MSVWGSPGEREPLHLRDYYSRERLDVIQTLLPHRLRREGASYADLRQLFGEPVRYCFKNDYSYSMVLIDEENCWMFWGGDVFFKNTTDAVMFCLKFH